MAEVCRAYGKFAGTVGSLETLDSLIETGYRFINIGADVLGLSKYCLDLTSEFDRKRRVAVPKSLMM